MSLARRWLDPIRSSWQLEQRVRINGPRTFRRGPLTVYLRLDDAYSYIAVQILMQLSDLVIEQYQQIKVVICTQPPADYPNDLSAAQWLRYSLRDVGVLAEQHRFIFQPNSHPPDAALMLKGLDVLRLSPLIGRDYLHLLQNVFHMLWQRQSGKLDTLYQMAQHRLQQQAKLSLEQQQVVSVLSDGRIRDQPLLAADIEFDHKHYRAIDDLLRLTRHLKRAGMLTSEPVLLINHVEWQEHLVSDPFSLADIQALQADLHVYIALEDPMSWLILSYLYNDMIDYYNVRLHVHPIAYRQRDRFDWAQAARLSRRVDVDFGPFCRPDEKATQVMAQILYATPPEQRLAQALALFKGVWTEGLDPSVPRHLRRMLGDEWMAQQWPEVRESQDQTMVWLAENEQALQRLALPDLPAMALTIDEQTHAFCGLYRVWQIETLLTDSLELSEDSA